MDANETMLVHPVDVTVAAWLDSGPDLGMPDKQKRAAYNTWAHETLQDAQRHVRSLKLSAFMDVTGLNR